MRQPSPTLTPRLLAAEILNRVGQQRHTLDHWLQWADMRHQDLQNRDRAFIRSIVYGTLRWRGRLDWIIDQFTARNAKAINPLVRTILRMGLFQILYMDRIPDSAAVNTSVEVAKHLKRQWAAGFINKILRRAAMESGSLPWPDINNEPVKALAVGQAFPQWMISRWIRRWGAEQTQRLCSVFNTIPPMTLRTNTLKTRRTDLVHILETAATTVHPTPFAPEGIVLSDLQGVLFEQAAFHQGLFQIQDEAAQLVSHLVNPKPGQTVWDACAGLGTKAAHLAQLMNDQGHIFATDIHAHKLTALAAETQRLGVTIVQQRRLDLNNADTLLDLPEFDRILLDAPCSGMGVIRKNPDSKWALTPEDLLRHQHRQVAFLDRVSGRLKPNGILVYSVCSMEPEETRYVVQEFLRKHPEFDIYRGTTEARTTKTRLKALMTAEHWLSTTPQDHGMDGFFAVALNKPGDRN